MISWIQRTFQQHYRILFLVLLAIVIVMFVFTIGVPGIGNPSGPQMRSPELFGRTLTPQEQEELGRDGSLSLMLSAYQGLEPLQRLAALHLADRFGVPVPTPAQLEEHIRQLPGLRGPDGTFSTEAYANFRDILSRRPDLGEARASRVIAEDWRIAQVEAALSGPGYVHAADVRKEFERMETSWRIETASLDLARITAPAEPTEEDLKLWYDVSSFRYESPARVRVSYVEFRGADYAARIQPTDEEIVAYFENNKARYRPPPPPPAEGETTPPPPPPEVTLADVRERVVTDYIQQRAAHAAATAASEFTAALYRAQITPGTDAFAQFLAARELPLLTTEPFSQQEAPAGSNWTPEVLAAAFRLSTDRPISREVRSGDNTLLLFLEEQIPPAPQPLEAVRERVLADVREEKRRLAITARGEELRAQLANAVKGGQSFADAATAAGLETKTWDKFKQTAPPPELDRAVLANLDNYAVREVSSMVTRADAQRGLFVFVTEREVPAPDSAAETFADVRRTMMENYARFSLRSILAEIVEKEQVAAGLITTPATP